MRELIIDRIKDMIESTENATVHDWNMMFDFDLGIINSDEVKLSEDPEEVAVQISAVLIELGDVNLLEVYDYIMLDSGVFEC